MGNKLSAPAEGLEKHSPSQHSSMRSAISSIRPRTSDAPTTLRRARTTPRSIDILDRASMATLSLRPPTRGLSPPRPLAATLKHRKLARTALTFFECGRNVFIHFTGEALLERDLVNAPPGTKLVEDAAEQVWIEIVMYDSEERSIWEDEAREARAALIGGEATADALLEAHCIPQHKVRLELLAASSVDELLKRYAAGTWPRREGQGFAPEVAAAARRASRIYATDKSETTQRMVDHFIEKDVVSAINLRDLPSSNFIGVEPSLRRFNIGDIDQSSVRSVIHTPSAQDSYPYPTSGPSEVVDAAATARLYLDLNMTPPRSNRHSLQSITTSLYTDFDTEPEIFTTERVTPAKARIVDCKR